MERAMVIVECEDCGHATRLPDVEREREALRLALGVLDATANNDHFARVRAATLLREALNGKESP